MLLGLYKIFFFFVMVIVLYLLNNIFDIGFVYKDCICDIFFVENGYDYILNNV